ncbi:GntR family transcriptional regulator [Gryllotalpicola protaetiae]|uniref:GntR family transcriptional regulator n=1 Tax=Gryllotalpicola protaetiae TaxID=2419771 RepID=A0A387BG60_9MICO|nr:GntR family transcriptional regulator [Gryllotalpicola protaetiae]AYG03025.1 GntR family transcriptional regulator [Gryllotalpicola protaetiae]
MPEKNTVAAGDRAYEDVKARILTSELAGGDLISEGEVADRLNISRTPVREAFLRLQAEGFMKLYPKRGAMITPIARSEARDVIDARNVLETHAVRQATTSAERTERLVAELRDNLQLQKDRIADRNLGGYALADAEFHAAIIRAGDNALIAQFYSTLYDRQVRMARSSIPTDLIAGDVVGEHAALVDAIEARDGDRFDALLATHLQKIHEVLIR